MKVFNKLYAESYDLLYNDKNYSKEVDYIIGLIKEINPQANTMLDFGCGTGKHAHIFAQNGFEVLGVDLSDEMINVACCNNISNNKLNFSLGDIRSFRTTKKFDVVVALFHVFSYLPTNIDVLNALETMKNHLNNNGLIIVDFWYGPAVLSIKPESKIKKLSNNTISITRISTPNIQTINNIVNVHFDMIVKNKQSNELFETQEDHPMRYFFIPELKQFFERTELCLLNCFEFLTKTTPTENSWNAIAILKKV